MILYVLLGIAIVIVLWFILAYNSLIVLRNRMRNAWSQIEVQLKRRYDLIPNLVNTVKGYAKHEKATLEEVTKARQQAIEASGVADQAKAENFLTQTLRSLFAVVENYPDLKANRNFLELQEELTTTENRISYARQFYNDSTMRLNNRIEKIPTNLVATLFSFKKAEFFEIEDVAERRPPKVEF